MNEQTEFWRGEFGDEYTARQEDMIYKNIHFFINFSHTLTNVESLIEFGAGSGMNLIAIENMFNIQTTGIEVNKMAHRLLSNISGVQAINACFLEDNFISYGYDMSMTKGVLIHIEPSNLRKAYERLYASSKKYILIAEYFSVQPREIEYRGHTGKMWARDFGGEMLDMFSDLKLIDCRFHYNRLTGQDNLTSWLFKKG